MEGNDRLPIHYRRGRMKDIIAAVTIALGSACEGASPDAQPPVRPDTGFVAAQNAQIAASRRTAIT